MQIYLNTKRIQKDITRKKKTEIKAFFTLVPQKCVKRMKQNN